LNQTAVSRIWRAFALQPHRNETFKLSKDPLFVDKVRDVVGLYMNPPERALVLCVDEKAQIQALAPKVDSSAFGSSRFFRSQPITVQWAADTVINIRYKIPV